MTDSLSANSMRIASISAGVKPSSLPISLISADSSALMESSAAPTANASRSRRSTILARRCGGELAGDEVVLGRALELRLAARDLDHEHGLRLGQAADLDHRALHERDLVGADVEVRMRRPAQHVREAADEAPLLHGQRLELRGDAPDGLGVGGSPARDGRGRRPRSAASAVRGCGIATGDVTAGREQRGAGSWDTSDWDGAGSSTGHVALAIIGSRGQDGPECRRDDGPAAEGLRCISGSCTATSWARWLFMLAHGASAAVVFRLRRERDPDTVRVLLDLSKMTMPAAYLALLLLIVAGVWAGIEIEAFSQRARCGCGRRSGSWS